MIDSHGITVSGGAVTGPSAPAATGGTTLSKDDFLRLLVTQLQHQDPLNPLDPNQFLAQTAQFSQLEQLVNINEALSALVGTSGSSDVAGAAALLGKTVKTAGSSFTFEGASASLPYTLEGGTVPVQIQILDQQGNLVRAINATPGKLGKHVAEWDGKDAAGHAMSGGTYYYRVTATNGSGTRAVASVASGALTGLEVNGGVVRYRLGSALIRPEDVIDVTL
jgi:flagellar basal-body rod modification protein FlgD